MNRSKRAGPDPLAVAIRYVFGKDGEVPQVVASGRGHLAKRILEIAAEHKVPVRTDPELAGALIDLPVGVEIPADLWELVATLLAQVYAADAQLRKAAKASGGHAR